MSLIVGPRASPRFLNRVDDTCPSSLLDLSPISGQSWVGHGAAIDLSALPIPHSPSLIGTGSIAYFEALLELSEITGRVSKDMKETLLTFMRLLSDEFKGGAIDTREMVALLAQLDGLLGINTSSDSKLLRFLFHDDLETLTSIRP